jgi:hypothetical protein
VAPSAYHPVHSIVHRTPVKFHAWFDGATSNVRLPTIEVHVGAGFQPALAQQAPTEILRGGRMTQIISRERCVPREVGFETRPDMPRYAGSRARRSAAACRGLSMCR